MNKEGPLPLRESALIKLNNYESGFCSSRFSILKKVFHDPMNLKVHILYVVL